MFRHAVCRFGTKISDRLTALRGSAWADTKKGVRLDPFFLELVKNENLFDVELELAQQPFVAAISPDPVGPSRQLVV